MWFYRFPIIINVKFCCIICAVIFKNAVPYILIFRVYIYTLPRKKLEFIQLPCACNAEILFFMMFLMRPAPNEPEKHPEKHSACHNPGNSFCHICVNHICFHNAIF